MASRSTVSSGSTVSPRPSPHASATCGEVASVVQGGGLDRRAGGDELVVGRDPHGAPGEVGDDAPVGRAAGGAADEEHRAVAPSSGPSASAPASRLQTTPSTAARASWAGVTSVRKPGQHAGRVRPVRRPLAVEVRDEDEAARSGRRLERQRVEPGVVDARAAAPPRRSPWSRSWCRPAGGSGRSHRRSRPPCRSDRLPARSETVNAVPLVPRLRARSPGRRPRPRAAAMLSPVPAATGIPAPRHSPATASGASTSGSAASQSTSSLTSRRRSVPVAAPRGATSTRCPRRPPDRWSAGPSAGR